MSQEIDKLQAFVGKELIGLSEVRVLEAGCGSASNLRFGNKVYLVGIDISEKQLARNTLLHEKIVGDIQQYEFPEGNYDAIVCWDVLEHLPEPQLALEKFARAIKPGGLVILKMPNVLSLKGLITKFMPHIFHVWAYRYIYGDKNAGKEDTVPFRTFLRLSISANAIRKQGAELGLDTVYFSTEDVANFHWLQKKKLLYFSYLLARKLTGVLSFEHLGDSELTIVLKKNHQQSAF